MKLTKKRILYLIRESLLEVFQPKESDYEEVSAKTGRGIDRFKTDKEGYLGSDLQRRVTGLQTPEEVTVDRMMMRKHQEDYKKGITEIFSAIKSGDITVMHSLSYPAGTEGFKSDIFIKKSAVDSWMSINGPRGKQSLSTVIFDIPYSDFKKGVVTSEDIVRNGNNRIRKGGSNINTMNMAKRGVQGIILKGYPVISGKFDLGTQTMSAVPQALLRHQIGSGLAKRSSKYEKQDLITSMAELKEFGGTEETVLDNWQVVAPYMVASLSPTLEKIKKAGIKSIKLDPVIIELFSNQEKYAQLYNKIKKIENNFFNNAEKLNRKNADYYVRRYGEGKESFKSLVDQFFFDWYLEIEEDYPEYDYDKNRKELKTLFYKQYQVDQFEKIKEKLKPIETIDGHELGELMTYFKLLNVSAKYKLDYPVII